jgi:hypothetical protein
MKNFSSFVETEKDGFEKDREGEMCERFFFFEVVKRNDKINKIKNETKPAKTLAEPPSIIFAIFG